MGIEKNIPKNISSEKEKVKTNNCKKRKKDIILNFRRINMNLNELLQNSNIEKKKMLLKI